MKIFTPALATTVGVQALQLHGGDIWLAYAFGVAIDVDHLIKAPFYLKYVGGLKDERGYYWRSSLQEPVALLWIVPLCIFLHTWVPIPFFIAHLTMDYAVNFEKMPLYPYSNWVTRGWLNGIGDGVKELVLFVGLLCTSLALLLARHPIGSMGR